MLLSLLKKYLLPAIENLKQIPPQQRVKDRITKFGKMGFWDETVSTDSATEIS